MWLQLLVIHVALNQTWIALIIFIITAIPSFAHRIAPITSAVAGFAGGFFVPTSLMPLWSVAISTHGLTTDVVFYYRYKWLFYINPNYYGFSAIGRVLLSDMKLGCVYESELECYPYSGPYILSHFDLDTVNPHYHIVVSDC